MVIHHPVENQILAALPQQAFDLLCPHLERVALPLKAALYEAGEPIPHIDFLESGMASLVIELDGEPAVEVGVIGREGLSGLPALLGPETPYHRSFMQMPGRGLRLKTEICCDVMQQTPAFRAEVLGYAQRLQNQVSQTAVCNVRHEVPARLARWLLLAHDRADDDDLPLTHEFLATMLGVRRPGVTVAAGILRDAGAISSTRARIRVKSRKRLEAASCACYRRTQNGPAVT